MVFKPAGQVVIKQNLAVSVDAARVVVIDIYLAHGIIGEIHFGIQINAKVGKLFAFKCCPMLAAIEIIVAGNCV